MKHLKNHAVKNTIWLGAAGAATMALTLCSQAAPMMKMPMKMEPIKMMPNVLTAPPMSINSAMSANLDKAFGLHAAAGNLFEVSVGKLALTKTKNPAVIAVAKTIIMGHSMGQAQLAKLMHMKGMMAPTMTGPAEMATLDVLKRTPRGAAFDKAFMAGQVEAHENTVVLFQHEIDSGKDSATVNLAKMQLPGILQHTALIYMVAKKVNAPGINMRPASLTMMSQLKMK